MGTAFFDTRGMAWLNKRERASLGLACHFGLRYMEVTYRLGARLAALAASLPDPAEPAGRWTTLTTGNLPVLDLSPTAAHERAYVVLTCAPPRTPASTSFAGAVAT